MDTIPPPRAPAATAEALERHDRPGPRYTSYPTADRFHDGYDETAYAASLAAAARREGPLSLYLHLPFCEHRCLYCACNVVVPRNVAMVFDRHLREARAEGERFSRTV